MGLMEKREFKAQQPGISEAETASNGGENGGQMEIWRCDGEVKGGRWRSTSWGKKRG